MQGDTALLEQRGPEAVFLLARPSREQVRRRMHTHFAPSAKRHPCEPGLNPLVIYPSGEHLLASIRTAVHPLVIS